MVAPRCPDEKGRSCLKGTEETTVAVAVDDGTATGFDPSRVLVLNRSLSVRGDQGEPKTFLTVREGGWKT